MKAKVVCVECQATGRGTKKQKALDWDISTSQLCLGRGAYWHTWRIVDGGLLDPDHTHTTLDEVSK